MTWRNEYEKSVLLFTQHCIIDAKIAVGFDAEITAPENAKNTAFVIPGYNDISSCADYYKIMTCVEFDLDLNCSKTGEIIGYNGTECMCCPGWIIKTGQDTIKVLNLPIESQVRNIVETSGFPIPVKLDYENISGTCQDFYKKVTCIKINN